MAICRYSKEYTASNHTSLDNVFIYEYLPEATGNAVKVYTYGLFLCQNSEFDIDVKTFADNLKMSEEEVLDAFTYWEEFGLVNVTSKNPLSVDFVPLRALNGHKPRKYKPEKYAGFTSSLQALIPQRMISVNEYSSYFDIMEIYGIKQEAMLMIVKYCVDLKGNDVGYKYISTVAKNFGEEKILTAEQVEKKLSSYVSRANEIEKILSTMNVKRKAEVDDLNLLNKWTKELGYEIDAIVYASSKVKKGSMLKLDKFILDLYSAKKFTKKEIEDYTKDKKNLFDIAVIVNKNLGIYIEVVDTVIDNFIAKWVSYGYDEKTLSFIANYCFRKNKKDLESMDEYIETFYKNGYITLESITEYFARITENDKFIQEILSILGLNRKPTSWDRENLKLWRSWNFSNEMILEASKLASDKKSPIAYVNAILGSWKNKNIFSPNDIEKHDYDNNKNNSKVLIQRQYTENELNSLIDNIADIEF